MNKLMDWMKGKFMKYHISDREYDMIQKDMQEENGNSLLFFSVRLCETFSVKVL